MHSARATSVRSGGRVNPRSAILVASPVLWPVPAFVLRHTASPIVIPATSAAIRSFGDRCDNGQCGDPEKQSSDPVHVRLLVTLRLIYKLALSPLRSNAKLGHSLFQIRTVASELGQYPTKGPRITGTLSPGNWYLAPTWR